jgi:hypothetical protein
MFKAWPSPVPALATAGAGSSSTSPSRNQPRKGGVMLFASGGPTGPNDGGYDDDEVYYDEEPQQTRRAPGASRGASPETGGQGSGAGGGRQRTIQYQPEERYWTEYLRIALPILGLILMIGLLWYWALQLTGDDNGDDPTPTDPPGTTEVIAPESTPTVEPTEEVIVPTPTTEPTEEVESTPEEEEETPEETDDEGTGEGEIAIGSAVVVTEDGVNMRDDATTEGNIVRALDAGEVLSIEDGPFEADGYVWWEVIVEETAETGFVVQDFLEPAEG